MNDQPQNHNAPHAIIEKFQVGAGSTNKTLDNMMIPSLESQIQLEPEPVATIPNPFDGPPAYYNHNKSDSFFIASPVIRIPGLKLKEKEEGMLREERKR